MNPIPIELQYNKETSELRITWNNLQQTKHYTTEQSVNQLLDKYNPNLHYCQTTNGVCCIQ